MNNEINDNIPARTSPGLTRSSFATTRNRVANDVEFGNFVITFIYMKVGVDYINKLKVLQGRYI